MPSDTSAFDRSAAVTRSLLGWGVVAGPFFLLACVILALFTGGFALHRDELADLMHGSSGGVARGVFVLAGLMVIAAAAGIWRTPGFALARLVGVLVGIHGLGMLLQAVPLDEDQPAGVVLGVITGVVVTVGILGFAACALLTGRWAAQRGEVTLSRILVACGVVMLIAFLGFFVLVLLFPFGMTIVRLAVIAEWLFLAMACLRFYRLVPHPVIAQREDVPAGA